MDGTRVVTRLLLGCARWVSGRSMRIASGLVLGVLAIGLTGAAPKPAPSPTSASSLPPVSSPAAATVVHPLHLSTSQLAVDEKTAWLRIRMFKDDLEAALATYSGVDSLALEPSAEHDSLFIEYFGKAFGLRFNGVEVTGVIESSGEDLESGEGELRIWWYQLRFDGAEVIRGVEVRNAVLYETFRDQRNIVRVLHAPTETRKTLYFASPDDGWGEVGW